MTFQFIPALQTYAFFFGTEFCLFDGEELFFENRKAAKAAAKRHGLYITNRNTVKVLK